MKTKKFKAVIEKVDEYDIHLEGDFYHRTAKTKEEAEKCAYEMETKAKQEWDEQNSEENRWKVYAKKVIRDLEDFSQELTNQCRCETRYNENKELTDLKKQINKKLREILKVA